MTNKKFTIAVALAALVLSAVVYKKVAQPVEFSPEVVAKFNAWLQQEKRLYATPSEMKLRLSNFKATLDRIDSVNNQNLGYTAGLNQFSDLSPEEFAAKYLMKTNPTKALTRRSYPNMKGLTVHGTEELQEAPESIDWRTKVGGNVPPVKNQEACGSCYAFAATTSIEYTLALSKKADHKYTGPVAP